MKTGSITATSAAMATSLHGSQPGPVVCRLHRPGGVAAARVVFILGGKIDEYKYSPGKGDVMSELIARLEQWLQIQWARFNLWLDIKRQYPRHKVTVRYNKETGTWTIGRQSIPWTKAEQEQTKREWEALRASAAKERERKATLRALMTPEQLKADDARRNKPVREEENDAR